MRKNTVEGKAKPTPSLPEAVAGNASAPVGEKRQPSGVQQVPVQPSITQRGKNDGSPVQRDPANGPDSDLAGQPSGVQKAVNYAYTSEPPPQVWKPEVTAGQPSGVGEPHAPCCVYCGLYQESAALAAPREVGEGLRERLKRIAQEHTKVASECETSDAQTYHTAYADALIDIERNILPTFVAALAAPAPKPAPPAERDDTDLEGRLNTGADFPS